MESATYIAVDWSGAKDEKEQLAGIWLAIAVSGSLVRLRNGLTREEVIALLVKEIEAGGPLYIGLDFAFSFPKWYLRHLQLDTARDLWNLAVSKGEEWLSGDTSPFWGRDKTEYKNRPEDL